MVGTTLCPSEKTDPYSRQLKVMFCFEVALKEAVFIVARESHTICRFSIILSDEIAPSTMYPCF
jgi:hypothetical protein